MMIATSHDSLVHISQNLVQGAAQTRIFEALGIADKIEALADEYAEQVLPYAGTMEAAKVQARRWVCEALCDYVAAIADYDLIFVS